MHDFQRLRVWQRARELVLDVHGATERFARLGHTSLRGQVRRCATSIPANIAEGCGKESRRETIRFLQIACGSAKELESHLIVAADLGCLEPNRARQMLAAVRSIQRMLQALCHNLP